MYFQPRWSHFRNVSEAFRVLCLLTCQPEHPPPPPLTPPSFIYWLNNLHMHTHLPQTWGVLSWGLWHCQCECISPSVIFSGSLSVSGLLRALYLNGLCFTVTPPESRSQPGAIPPRIWPCSGFPPTQPPTPPPLSEKQKERIAGGKGREEKSDADLKREVRGSGELSM